jgi:flagellar hook-associated protein 1
MSILSTGLSGLLTSRDGLSVASNNVANANNPDYKRQELRQESGRSQFQSSGYLGQGVRSIDVVGIDDQFLKNQIIRTSSQTAYSDTLGNQLSRIDELLATDNNALSESMTAFIGAVQDLSLRPTDIPGRQNLLQKAGFVADQFNSLGGRMDAIRKDTNTTIKFKVDEINGLTTNLAKLNEQVARESALGNGKNLPLDLMDKRDALILDLSNKLDVQVINGSLAEKNIFMRNGQPLVTSAQSFNLIAIEDPTDPQNVVIAKEVGVPGAPPARVALRNLGQGELSALMEFRDGALTRYQNTLGLMALRFQEKVNQVQTQGFDLNGAAGQPLFNIRANGSNMYTGVSEVINAFDNVNFKQVEVTQLNSANLSTPEYEVFRTGPDLKYRPVGSNTPGIVMTVTADAPPATTFTASTPNVGTPATAPLFSLRFSAAPEDGDKFVVRTTVRAAQNLTINPDIDVEEIVTRGATTPPSAPGALPVGDNSKLLELTNVLDEGSLYMRPNGTGVSIRDAFSRMITVVGNDVISARNSADTGRSVLNRLEEKASSVSGVNLDEEAAQLIRYQQAYSANAKVVSLSSELFEDLLSAIR